jgi:hypothetical protein
LEGRNTWSEKKNIHVIGQTFPLLKVGGWAPWRREGDDLFWVEGRDVKGRRGERKREKKRVQRGGEDGRGTGRAGSGEGWQYSQYGGEGGIETAGAGIEIGSEGEVL